MATKWKTTHPLFRGDSAASVAPPVPSADPSLVRHILYLDGPGRSTPYISTTEDESVARRFAGSRGRIYQTRVPDWSPRRVQHRARTELVQLLRGKGKGDASWPSAHEVIQARAYVEDALEHLADFRGMTGDTAGQVVVVVKELFR